MSTICKLDPTVRRARIARRELQTHLESELFRVRRYPIGPRRNAVEAFIATALGVLETVIRSPYRTGEAKNVIARTIALEYTALITPPKPQEQPQ